MNADQIWTLIEKSQGNIAGAIRRLLNEPPIGEHNLTDEQSVRRVNALRDCAVQMAGGLSPEQRHEEWIKSHTEQGWVYGDEYDAATKRHPNLIPWEMLSRSAKAKIEIFGIMAALGAALTKPTEESVASDASDNPHSDLPKA